MGASIELTAADGARLSAYTAGAEDAKHGLVVVQEIFGVNHHMRSVADRFAAAGYAVVAPAIFDRAEKGVELGYSADDVARGRAIRQKLTEDGVLADIQAAAAKLGTRRVGIVGFCFGGAVSWWGATRTKAFSAASCWYGGGIAATADAHPHCPVQMHFGEKDTSIPLSDVDKIRAAQPGAEIFVYPGAQHGFGCDERGSFSAPDRDLAQTRTLEFFARTLGG